MSIPVAPEDKKPLFPERNPISSPQISSQPVAKMRITTFGKYYNLRKNFALIESSLANPVILNGS
ncbi:hypothetical protein J4727_09705 [Providencia rettgeri]|uniref:Uncharacterized protein n=1 Tax=Providencia rettgeri TaxID=587 RepID=A0A939NBV1_PRORE|nr:hypothetical protein [Providencia rettgeri]